MNKIKSIIDHCSDSPDDSGIVYCQTRRSVKELAVQLRNKGIAAGIYHGGMKPEDRSLMLNEWMNERLKVMVATNAFGMGIDKPNVRYVLHYEFPDNLEAYYQEAGRAGRDNEAATAILFYNRLDLEQHRTKLEQKYPDAKDIKATYDGICNFLSIATGSGENESYPFDIQDFAKKFNLKASEVYASLKILSHNEVIAFDNNTFYPTRLKFNIGQSTLYKFQVAHEELNSLITNLTRSYPGIFDRFIRINEKELSKRINTTQDGLRTKLRALEKFGIVEINFQSSLPHLTLLQPRIAPGQLSLRPDAYKNRKERDLERLDAMINFVLSPNCRAEQIASYFGSPTRKCGKCDVCQIELTEEYSSQEFQQLILNKLPASLHELEVELKAQQERIMNSLNRLISEETILFKDGRYIKT
jgi:ATP-dependent DNA helicase RecQ